jgi:single-strand DNA-binding protein
MSSAFDINAVTISGNLTRNPELRSLPGGNSVCNIRIAHNERYKTGNDWTDRPQYFDVTVWSGLGEYLAENLTKGGKVVVHGRLKWREFEVEGNKRQAVDITADSVIPVPRSDSASAEPAGAFEHRDADEDIPF